MQAGSWCCMSDPLHDLITQGKWLDVASAITYAHVQQLPPVAILPDPARPKTFTYGPASLVERVEKTLQQMSVTGEYARAK